MRGYRSDIDFLCRVLEAVIDEGATTLNIPDTVGYAIPELYGNFIKNLRERIPNSDKAIWSVHCHNDLGMAVANSLAGVKLGGARQVECTINGLGERAGNTALEEVVMGLKHAYGIDAGIDTHRFREISLFVAKASQRPLSVSKPVVGSRVFAHESGLHADGVIKDPHNYEGFDPAEVGLTRSIVVGKHSGTSGLIERYREMGITIGRSQAEPLLERARALAGRRKRDLSNCELMSIYFENERLPKAA